MSKLLPVPGLAVLAVTATVTAQSAHPPGGRRTTVGGGVSVVLPAGWHLTHGTGTSVRLPIPRLSAATFAARFSRRHCVCDTPRIANFPRNGVWLFVWEQPGVGRRDFGMFRPYAPHFRVSRSTIAPGQCSSGDTKLFRIGRRGFEAEIYLGPDAPPSARRQIAAILDSWQVTSAPA